MARIFNYDYSKQSYLFEDAKPNEELVLISHCEFIGIYYTYLYDIFKALQCRMGYALELDALLNDLVVMQIFVPASKLRSEWIF